MTLWNTTWLCKSVHLQVSVPTETRGSWKDAGADSEGLLGARGGSASLTSARVMQFYWSNNHILSDNAYEILSAS